MPRWRAAALDRDAPEPRAVQGPELGEIIELPEVGGLHHRYVRAAAQFSLGWVLGSDRGRPETKSELCTKASADMYIALLPA